MSSALALAAVTTVLRNMLDERLISCGVAASLGGVTVSALPPDRVPIGADEHSQLNVFLYRLTPNSSWRKLRSATTSPPAGDALSMATRPPLALDLHYLVTAYGEQDFHAEILLGHAMQVMHDRQALSRAVHADARLADQFEQLTICPEFLSSEESSRLWSSLQARYRPSVTYLVSAVVIDGSQVTAT